MRPRWIPKPRRRWGFIAGASTLCAILIAVLVWRGHSAPSPTPKLKVRPTLALEVRPDRVRFVLSSPSHRPLVQNVLLRVILDTPAGPITRSGRTDATSSAVLEVPYARAGWTAYKLDAGPFVFTGSFVRHPGQPVTPLELKIGARAARVVGSRPPALVMHPLDAQENVSDEAIDTVLRPPDGREIHRRIEVKHLTAWMFLTVGDRPGRLEVSASSGSARGERGEADIQPGPLLSGSLETLEPSVPADRREVWPIRLRDARDARGNPAMDGSVVEFSTSGNDRLFATRPLVRGTASLDLPPVVSPGTYTIRANGEGLSAKPLRLEALPPLQLLHLPARFEAGPPLQVVIGPVTDRDGALPDTGTPILIELRSLEPVTNRERVEYAVTVPLERGRAVWTLPPLPANSRLVRIETLGKVAVLPIAAQNKKPPPRPENKR